MAEGDPGIVVFRSAPDPLAARSRIVEIQPDVLVLDLLATRYPDRIIIFDSPPLLITTESRVLASYMGQVVLVVEAGSTPRDAVKEALAAIGDPGMVGLVLNKSRDARAGGHYGYEGYGYGAG